MGRQLRRVGEVMCQSSTHVNEQEPPIDSASPRSQGQPSRPLFVLCWWLLFSRFHRPAYLVQGRAASRMGDTKRRAQQQVILQGEVGARAWRLCGQTREEVGAISRHMLFCFGCFTNEMRSNTKAT